jgi:hypothetical protein
MGTSISWEGILQWTSFPSRGSDAPKSLSTWSHFITKNVKDFLFCTLTSLGNMDTAISSNSDEPILALVL